VDDSEMRKSPTPDGNLTMNPGSSSQQPIHHLLC